MRVIAIAAVARNGVIGSDGSIPWHLPADFAHFKTTTLGHTLLMGRATYDSIGRPLPGRSTIVLSRDPALSVAHESVTVAHSVGEALARAAELPGDLYVAGGAAVYEALLPYLDEQLISEVHLEPEGDTHYPVIDRATWREVERRQHEEFDVVRWRRVAQSS